MAVRFGLLGILIAMFFLGFVLSGNAEKPDSGEPSMHPCPDSPNCVSTQSEREKQTMEPLPYLKSREKSRERILSIIEGMKRTEVVEMTENYIHAEFRSALWGFVDDVEFFFDDEGQVIHFRSASRTGYYDFGVNRRRMKHISEQYLTVPNN